MSLVSFDRLGTPARILVEDRDHGVCAACGMDTEYVKRLLEPLLAEAVSRLQRGEIELARALRVRAAEALIDLGFSGTVAGRAVGSTWNVRISTHLWEADHIVPVVHGGGGACGLENLRTLCRRCHVGQTRQLAYRRAKDKRVRRKQERHAARMRAKQERLL